MPIEVDESQRLDEIAKATIEVARRHGAHAVTIRAVARELGGSTAMVTNYVPNRVALMVNALRLADGDWQHDMRVHLAGLTERPRLEALVRWMCTTTRDDDTLRHLWIEILATTHSGAAGTPDPSMREWAHDAHQEIGEAVAEAALPDPRLSTDILHLLVRGYFISTMEDPAGWPAERAADAALAVIGLLRHTPAPTSEITA